MGQINDDVCVSLLLMFFCFLLKLLGKCLSNPPNPPLLKGGEGINNFPGDEPHVKFCRKSTN